MLVIETRGNMLEVSDTKMDIFTFAHTPSRMLNIHLLWDDHIVVTTSLPSPIHIGISILIMVIDA